jgi:hypothetical protein
LSGSRGEHVEKQSAASLFEWNEAELIEEEKRSSYDSVFDACANGQRLKCLTIVDERTRESLAIDVAGSIRFRSPGEAIAIIETWRRHYNDVRPHSSLGYVTPSEFKKQCMSTSTRNREALLQ